MKKILFAFVLTPLTANAWGSDNYNDCVLENMKAGLSSAGVSAIKQACRNKYASKPYVPAKCKEIVTKHRPTPNGSESLDEFLARTEESASLRESCINECRGASFWSKHFGDCKE